MKSLKFKVKVTFLEEVLGTSCSNPKIHEQFIASHAPDAKSTQEEVEAVGVDAVVEKAMTVFPKFPDGKPFVFDYMWRGAFKDACGLLARATGSESSKLKAYKKMIDGLVFVYPRKIPLKGGPMGDCQRPLRAATAQGERIALANSETMPAGTTMEFEVELLNASLKPALMEWLEYGEKRGFGGWRNSGKGIFKAEVKEMK